MGRHRPRRRRARGAGGGRVGLGGRRASALRVSAVPGRRPLSPERHRASRPARARAPREAPRARRSHPRAHGRDPTRSRRRSRSTIGSGACERRRPCRQLGRRELSGIPALARRRVQPHRPHRADPGRPRRARLDGRRSDRGQPHARPLHAHDARRTHRLRLGRRGDGDRRPRRPTASSSTGTSSRRRSARFVASSLRHEAGR